MYCLPQSGHSKRYIKFFELHENVSVIGYVSLVTRLVKDVLLRKIGQHLQLEILHGVIVV